MTNPTQGSELENLETTYFVEMNRVELVSKGRGKKYIYMYT